MYSALFLSLVCGLWCYENCIIIIVSVKALFYRYLLSGIGINAKLDDDDGAFRVFRTK